MRLKETGIYALPTAIFVLLSACGFALVVQLGGEWLAAAKILLSGLQVEGGGKPDFARATALVIGAGFVGAYIWSTHYLILRIANLTGTAGSHGQPSAACLPGVSRPAQPSPAPAWSASPGAPAISSITSPTTKPYFCAGGDGNRWHPGTAGLRNFTGAVNWLTLPQHSAY